MARSRLGTNSGRSGRGPTRLMSPRSTFHNWGSSSRWVRRRRRPTGVTRGSPGVDQQGDRGVGGGRSSATAGRRGRTASGAGGAGGASGARTSTASRGGASAVGADIGKPQSQGTAAVGTTADVRAGSGEQRRV